MTDRRYSKAEFDTRIARREERMRTLRTSRNFGLSLAEKVALQRQIKAVDAERHWLKLHEFDLVDTTP